jgi:hypothetical protein
MVLGFSDFVEWINGRKSRSANSFSVGTGFLSRIPTSPLASAVRRAASICSATRFVSLLGALADLVAVPRELVPPELGLLLFIDHVPSKFPLPAKDHEPDFFGHQVPNRYLERFRRGCPVLAMV